MRRDAKERIKKRVRRAFALAVSAWLSAQLPIYAQSAEDQARIDYESANLAFVKGDFKLALSKVESVMQVLGPDPTLLTFAAGAAFENRDVPGARDYAKRAYAAADPMFKGSDSYQQLIALSARIELEGPAIERNQAEAFAREQQAALERAAAEAWAEAERRARDERAAAHRVAFDEAQRQGYWIDPQSLLMWTARDNGSDLKWADAREYCERLRVNELSNWRLPTITELQQLYDPSLEWGSYSMRGPFLFGNFSFWSETKVSDSVWVFRLRTDEPVALSRRNGQAGALCVRSSTA